MPGTVSDPRSFIINEGDVLHEEEIVRNPYSLKNWWRYFQHKANASQDDRIMLYERAVKMLPMSYKLWKAYLDERRMIVQELPLDDPEYERLNNTYERALVFMNKMPRIWLDFCEFLMLQRKITRTRHTFDEALKSLPITQHDRIWKLYLEFIRQSNVPEMAVRVHRRYLKLEPTRVEEYIDYLLSIERRNEAATRLAEALNNEKFVSIRGKTYHQLWMELTDLCSEHPRDISGINVERIIRSGIERFADQRGKLWTSLAQYYIKLNQFEQARNVFEEGCANVQTVRDFTQIFDTYAKFEETIINTKMAAMETDAESVDTVDLDIRLARFADLMERRPFLVNDVLLRQNPNNVHEWQKRAELFAGRPEKVVETYTKAVMTVDPKQATGKLNSLWINFAKFYESQDLPKARAIFEKAVKVDFKLVDDLANVWCEYAEMELRHNNLQAALQLMGRATAPPRKKGVSYFDQSETVQNRLFKSLKLWSFYADLEESIGTVDTCKAVYDRILELKIATPQIVMNYALFLEENKYFEDSYKVYERGIEAFGYPVAFELWNIYLNKFVKRYGGSKLERARDLFEQALEKCPAKFCKDIYLMYAKLEEDFGLAPKVMKIFDRASTAVEEESRLEIFERYIQKASDTFGVTSTREIFQKAVEILNDRQARIMCLKFAELERQLGEIDRARAIYSYASQFADPRIDSEFWDTWNKFEINHGNETTFREMLRIKRSVLAQFNIQVNLNTAHLIANKITDSNQMKILEKAVAEGKANEFVAFVPATKKGSQAPPLPPPAAVNPDEIELDEEDEMEVDIEEKIVPDTVFKAASS